MLVLLVVGITIPPVGCMTIYLIWTLNLSLWRVVHDL